MKIGLVNLDSPFLINPKVFPPLGILYVAAKLRELGHEITFYDFAGIPKDEYSSIKINKEDYLFFTLTSPQIELFQLMHHYYRPNFDNSKIVIGGSGVNKHSLNNLDGYYSAAVMGEAEDILPAILFSLRMTPNKSYIHQGTDVDVETNPFPARDLAFGYKYKIDGIRTTTIMSSRGCPYSCKFCVSGCKKGLRVTLAKRVCEEIDEIKKLKFGGLMFFDDIFTLDTNRLKEIGSHIINKGMVFRCFTHTNFVNEELCRILVNTNCREIGIGIESGSDKILKTIGKGATSDKALKAVRLLQDHGIRVKTFLMLGLPGETQETIDETKKWLEQASPYNFDISIFQPFPSTDIWDNKDKYDINWSGNNIGHFKGKPSEYRSNVWTKELSKSQIEKERDSIERTFKGG